MLTKYFYLQEAVNLWMGVVNSLKAAGLYDGIQYGTPSASPGGSVDYLQW